MLKIYDTIIKCWECGYYDVTAQVIFHPSSIIIARFSWCLQASRFSADHVRSTNVSISLFCPRNGLDYLLLSSIFPCIIIFPKGITFIRMPEESCYLSIRIALEVSFPNTQFNWGKFYTCINIFSVYSADRPLPYFDSRSNLTNSHVLFILHAILCTDHF